MIFHFNWAINYVPAVHFQGVSLGVRAFVGMTSEFLFLLFSGFQKKMAFTAIC